MSTFTTSDCPRCGASRSVAESSLGYSCRAEGCSYRGVGKVPAVKEHDAGSYDDLDHLTDLGNARRLVRLYGDRLRYVPEYGAFFAWDTRRWKKDRTGAVQRMAKDVARTIHEEALEMSDRKQAAEVSKHAFRSESEARLNAMVNLAKTELNIAVVPEQLDADPWAFNVENGTLDLRTGSLRPHAQSDLITKLAPVRYDPDATCPTFDAFMMEIMGEDAELVAFKQRAVGAAMVGEILEHVLLFLYGLGANGKTTFLNIVLSMFGEYGQQAEPDLLIQKRNEAHPTGVADLKGARLVTTSEINAGRRLDESLVKQLTGGDRVKARYMRQDYFEFEPSHTLFMAANHKPVVKGTDNAIWRRIRLIPFEVTIPPERQDPRLSEKLEAELPGILNWALEGCRRWQETGLDAPEAVMAATAHYRADMDDLGGFLDEHCIIDERAEVEAKDLYEKYKVWAEQSGVRQVARKAFGQQLQDRGFATHQDSRTRRVIYLGIRLNTGCEAVRSRVQHDRLETAHVETNRSTPSHGFADGVDELLDAEVSP